MIQCNEKSLFEHKQYLLDGDTDKLNGMMEGLKIPNILKIQNYVEFNKNSLRLKTM